MDRADADDGIARLALTREEDDTARLASEKASFEEAVAAIVGQLTSH